MRWSRSNGDENVTDPDPAPRPAVVVADTFPSPVPDPAPPPEPPVEPSEDVWPELADVWPDQTQDTPAPPAPEPVTPQPSVAPALPAGRVGLDEIHRRGWPGQDALSSFGVSDTDLAAAEAAGIDLDDYYLVRRTGASHTQTLELAGTPGRVGNLLSYVAARWSGASGEEIADAAGRGMAHVDYGIARARGLSHEDAIDSFELGVAPAELESLTRAGIDREEIRAVRAAGLELRHYAAARMVGASSTELGEVIAARVALSDYTLARHSATHAEILSAYNAGADLFRYSSGRHAGMDHETALRRALSGAVGSDSATLRS